MRKSRAEVHVVIDMHGIDRINIVGVVSENQNEGHILYSRIRDLLQSFDTKIQKKLNEDNSKSESDSDQLTSSSSEN